MEHKIKIVSIGELLWDCFPDGRLLGGAPVNVAFHCAQLGADACTISAVGSDESGDMARYLLRQRGINTIGLQTSKYPTGFVKVTVSAAGKPDYCISSGAAWDYIQYQSGMKKLATDAHAVYFGSLAQRNAVSRKTILRFLDACGDSCLKIFDINLRQNYFTSDIIKASLDRADVLKLNDEELPLLSELFGLSGNVIQRLNSLLKIGRLKTVALTRGREGAMIVSGDTISDFPGIPVAKIADTVGAGDAFTAVLIIGLIKRLDLDEINRQACNTAAYVCSQSGATPELPVELTVAWK